jgi:hypothetical protein
MYVGTCSLASSVGVILVVGEAICSRVDLGADFIYQFRP